MQQGMSRNDMASVEHVADIKELEDLLNDKIAKQRVRSNHSSRKNDHGSF